MNLTLKFTIFASVLIISLNTFSQISIDQELKGRVAGLTVFPQGGRPGPAVAQPLPPSVGAVAGRCPGRRTGTATASPEYRQGCAAAGPG